MISRVTGGQLSYIDGTLRSTMPQADMYLINPAGILFGPHASLDVAGSFHASTASTVRLQDGSEFNARHPEQSTLTIAPPAAFGFLDDSPATLRLEGTRLSMPTGKTLSLVGGEVQLEQADLSVENGRLNLASVAKPGEVQLTDLTISASTAQMTLDHTQLRASDIRLQAGQLALDNSTISVNTVDTDNNQGIAITADDVTIKNGSQLTSTHTGTGQGGNIKINATGSVDIAGSEGMDSGITTVTENVGYAGHINVTSRELHLHGNSYIESGTTGTGQGGDITLQAQERIGLDTQGEQVVYPGYIYSSTTHLGTGGTIKLTADQLYLTKSAVIVTDTSDSGHSGDIVIDVSQLLLTEGAQIVSVTLGDGQGGDILVKATDNITLSGENESHPSGLFSETDSIGRAGTITLKTDQLFLKEGAQVSTTTYGAGQGGHVVVEAGGEVKISGNPSGLFSESDEESTGQAGQINLKAKNLTLEKGAKISTTTYSIGEGGIVKIHITETMNLTDAKIASNAKGEMDSAGAGGFIIVEADSLTLNENSSISAGSEGMGLAGNINLTVGKVFNLKNSAITTGTNQADGGDITIASAGYIYLVNGRVTTSVKAQEGNGGNITLSPEFVVLRNGKIIAQAVGGNGGNIDIKTTSIYKFPPISKNIIDASSQLGIDGEINISSPDINIEDALFSLPEALKDASVLLKRCGMIDEDLRSSFLIIPYAGPLNSPADWKPSGLLVKVSEAHHSTQRGGTTTRPTYQTLLW